MMKFIKICIVASVSLVLMLQSNMVLAMDKVKKYGPVIMIMNVEGNVEYSKHGNKWRKVKRNKFLFPGYQIRTGKNGSGTFLNQKTGLARSLMADTHVEITVEGATPIKGELGEPFKGKSDLVASLGKRFKKNQKYTTVRRGLKIKLGAASNSKRSPYKLSPVFPNLVWDNVIENPIVKQGSKITDKNYNEFSYRLTVDDKVFDVSVPKNNLIVRYKLADLQPGIHKYKVELLRNGELVSEKVKRASSFVWVDKSEQDEIMDRLSSKNGDKLLEAISLDTDGIKVGALDLYMSFFAENLDEIDMRPQMLEHLRSLKLGELLSREGELYKMLSEKDV